MPEVSGNPLDSEQGQKFKAMAEALGHDVPQTPDEPLVKLKGGTYAFKGGIPKEALADDEDDSGS